MSVDLEIHHAKGGIIGQFIYYLILLVLRIKKRTIFVVIARCTELI